MTSALAISLAVPVLSGCALSGGVDSDTIKVMLSGQKPTGWDQVMAEYEKTGEK